MTLCAYLILAATSLLWTAQVGVGAPNPSSKALRALFKRDRVIFDDCGDESDERCIKAGRAYAEAATLASFTILGTTDDSNRFQGTNAYSHYFKTDDSVQVGKMFSSIQSGSSGDTGNAFQLDFVISCKATDQCGESLAITDAEPLSDTFTPIIRLCPQFFKDPRTKNFLNDKDFTRDPGRRDNSWCQPNQPFEFFETAGHTLLHEMTHLDQLGVAAGLNERQTTDPRIQSHGTDDIYDIAGSYESLNPEQAARRLYKNWEKYDQDNGNKKPELERVENAEGYAAAATEFWFQSKCGWDEIQQ